MEIGYFLSSEEHPPAALVHQARRAEEVGMSRVWISDHFHPWLDEQGQSPFVWSVIGAIAASTELHVGTAVTCPTVRIHPAIVAQAAATSALLLDGRFELGVGTGEALNEHILGDRWPPADVRLAMLDEAVEVIRPAVDRRGRRPSRRALHGGERPAVLVAPEPAAGDRQRVRPEGRRGGGAHRRRAGDLRRRPRRRRALPQRRRQRTGQRFAEGVLGPPTRDACVEEAHRLWRSSGLPGELSQELPTPQHFAQGSQLVTKEATGDSTPCGPDTDEIVERLGAYRDAGYDHVYLNQIGPRQDEFFDFYRDELGTLLAKA